jgi:predicted metalloprotease with PDZ domain
MDCFITGRAVFIVPDIDEEKEALDMIVNFDLPSDWKVDSPWEGVAENKNSFRVKNIENLIKPYIAFGKYHRYDYKVKDVNLSLVILGDILRFEDHELLILYKKIATY